MTEGGQPNRRAPSLLFLVLLVPLLGTMLLPLTVAGAALLAHRLDSPGQTG